MQSWFQSLLSIVASRGGNLGKKLRFYPPFLLMGVRILNSGTNPASLHVRLPLSWRTRNSGGSIFGGFQAAMADPIAPVVCLMSFKDIHVWTRKLELDYVARSDEDIFIHLTLSDEQKNTIQTELDQTGRSDPIFTFALTKKDGTLCTRVRCQVTIKTQALLSKTSQ